MNNIDFKFYLMQFWRRFPLFMLIFLVIAAAGITVAYVLPPVYRAEATILVEPPPTTLSDSVLTFSPTQHLETIRQRLMRRQNLLEVADKLGIFADQPNLSPGDQIAVMQDSTQFQLVALGQSKRSRTPPNAVSFTVSYLSSNPQIAAQVTNEFVTELLNESSVIRTEDIRRTLDFFRIEAEQRAAELDDLERQLVIFRTQNGDAMPTSLPFRMQQVAMLEGQVRQLDDQAQALGDQRDQLIRTMEDPSLLPAQGIALTPEQQQLNALNAELLQNVLLSDQHPRMVALRARIAELETLIASQADTLADGEGSAPNGQLQLQLDQINLQLDRLAASKAEIQERIAGLNTTIARTPDVEMQLNILVRDRDAVQSEYNQAVNKRNAAERGETTVTQQQDDKFELIQQANVPDFPESPNRLLIAAGGIMGGIAAALGVLLLLELLNQSIRRPAELVQGLGIQPFATIPYIATRAEIIRSRLRMAAGFATVAIGVPALLYVVHYQYVPLDLLMTNMLEKFGLGGIAAALL